MKKLIVSILLVCATSVAHAEDKKPAAAPGFDVEKFVVFLEKVMDTIAANKDDCGKMAGAVSKLADDNKDFLAVVRAHKPTEEQQKEMRAKYSARVKAAFDKAKDAAMKCKDSADFKSAMERIPH